MDVPTIFDCTKFVNISTCHWCINIKKITWSSIIISYGYSLNGVHKFILRWYTLYLVHKARTHIQIQFELYYFHYNICLHTDAIYVLLLNVAVAAVGSKSNHTRMCVRLSHIVGIDSVCGWCVCVNIKSQQHIC